VSDTKREPFDPGEGSGEADDRLRDRVAAARTSIGEMLRESVERLERQERAALRAAEDRLSRIAAERVDDALIRLGVETGQLQGEVERRLEMAIERLAAEVGERLGAAQVQLEELAGRSAGRGVGAGAQRDLLERAAKDALASIREAESRAVRFVSDATETLAATERPTEGAVAKVEQATERIERAIAEVAETERRVRGIEERAGRMEGRMAEAADTAARAVDWEARMAAAARTEAEVARRIQDAERRLLGLAQPDDEPAGGPLS
jgi:hypothetical protein